MTDNAKAGTVYEGALIGVRADRIVGWAWDQGRPYDPIDVDLHIGSLRVGTVRADLFDRDLALRHKGNGCHAFEATLSLLPEGTGPFTLQAYLAGTAEAIGSPLIISDREILERLLLTRSLAGRIDGIQDGAVRGWVADLTSPASKPDLSLAYDGRPLSHTLIPSGHIEHEGRVVSGWLFTAPLPHDVLDGKLHEITAAIGNLTLAGGPLTFGPASAGGAIQAIAALTRHVADLQRQVAILPAAQNTDGLIEILSDQVLDRVDMLLAIYRDTVEQELDLMRAQVLAQRPATGESDRADPVLPVLVAHPATRPVRPASAPVALLFDDDLPLLGGTISRVADASGIARATITQAIAIALPVPADRRQTLVVRGVGATSAQALLAWQFDVSGFPVLGRFEIDAHGAWTFTGHLTAPAQQLPRLDQLTIRPGFAYVEEEVLAESLSLTSLSFADAHLSGTAAPDALPVAAAYHIAGQIDGRGWHKPEGGQEAWYRWGGRTPGLRAHLKPRIARQITVIGESHVPGEAQALTLRVNDETLPGTFRETGKPYQRWILEARAPASETPQLWTEVAMPPGFSKSPMAFEGSGDRRILSVSARAIAFDRMAGEP